MKRSERPAYGSGSASDWEGRSSETQRKDKNG